MKKHVFQIDIDDVERFAELLGEGASEEREPEEIEESVVTVEEPEDEESEGSKLPSVADVQEKLPATKEIYLVCSDANEADFQAKFSSFMELLHGWKDSGLLTNLQSIAIEFSADNPSLLTEANIRICNVINKFLRDLLHGHEDQRVVVEEEEEGEIDIKIHPKSKSTLSKVIGYFKYGKAVINKQLCMVYRVADTLCPDFNHAFLSEQEVRAMRTVQDKLALGKYLVCETREPTTTEQIIGNALLPAQDIPARGVVATSFPPEMVKAEEEAEDKSGTCFHCETEEFLSAHPMFAKWNDFFLLTPSGGVIECSVVLPNAVGPVNYFDSEGKEDAAVVLFSGGNGFQFKGCKVEAEKLSRTFYKHHEKPVYLYTFTYKGVGRSFGNTTGSTDIVEVNRTIIKYFVEVMRFNPQEIYPVGVSLGGASAITAGKLLRCYQQHDGEFVVPKVVALNTFSTLYDFIHGFLFGKISGAQQMPGLIRGILRLALTVVKAQLELDNRDLAGIHLLTSHHMLDQVIRLSAALLRDFYHGPVGDFGEGGVTLRDSEGLMRRLLFVTREPENVPEDKIGVACHMEYPAFIQDEFANFILGLEPKPYQQLKVELFDPSKIKRGFFYVAPQRRERAAERVLTDQELAAIERFRGFVDQGGELAATCGLDNLRMQAEKIDGRNHDSCVLGIILDKLESTVGGSGLETDSPLLDVMFTNLEYMIGNYYRVKCQIRPKVIVKLNALIGKLSPDSALHGRAEECLTSIVRKAREYSDVIRGNLYKKCDALEDRLGKSNPATKWAWELFNEIIILLESKEEIEMPIFTEQLVDLSRKFVAAEEGNPKPPEPRANRCSLM